jgi:phospholipase/carboxylesterase
MPDYTASTPSPIRGPHQGQPVRIAGTPLAQAQAAMIMVHGRGAGSDDILSLVGELDQPGWAFLAPQAAGYTWYPNSFLAPIPTNEPGISSGLAAIADLLARIAAAGIPAEKTMLLGFSQGACLTLEFAARHARRYGALIGLSGGLIGPDSAPRDYPGDFAGTPVFLGCSDVDPHIPRERVEETAAILRRMGADVTARLYRGMGHTVNADEIAQTRALLRGLVS